MLRMTALKRSLPIWLAFGFVLAGAAVHGAITQRWSVFAPNVARTERMHAVTVKFTDAEVTDVPHDVPLKERSIATSRRFFSASQNVSAMISVISGVPGAVSTHTPDVCYTGTGYKMTFGPKREKITMPDGKTAMFFVADFEKRKATEVERLRVRWAWTADGTWDAPDFARFQYMKASELYKLYIVTALAESPTGDRIEDAEPTRAFVRDAFAQYAAAFANVPTTTTP